MSTPRQTLANRHNAQHSTGPVSPQGKARSAANSLRHGLTAKKIVLDSVEDKLIFEELAGGLREEFQPSTPHENILVDTMIQARWTALRCIAQEKASYEAAIGREPVRDRCVTFMDEAYHEPHRRLFRATSRRELDSIHRYHAGAMRGYYRAVKELTEYRKQQAAAAKAATLTAQPQPEPQPEAAPQPQPDQMVAAANGFVSQKIRSITSRPLSPAPQPASPTSAPSPDRDFRTFEAENYGGFVSQNGN